MSNFDDIYRMHQHFQLPIETRPVFLSTSDQLFRENFLREELLEFEGSCKRRDLPEAADALIDLVVVTMGTAVMMGLPWEALWNDVLRANMSKERVVSKRAQGGYDLGKPEGWERPRSKDIIMVSQERGVPAPAYPSASPHVVTLCGSTRFKDEYTYCNRQFTLQGYVVLSCGFFSHADDEELDATTKAELDQLHLHKIDMSDSIFVINPDGYIGDSTRAEIDYAKSRGKDIHYLDTPGETNLVLPLMPNDIITP